jgi:hypothetical protein
MSSVQMWQVQLPNGIVHEVSVDQIDEAFESGHINESTLVREVGTAEWSTLAQMAGLDENPAPVSTAPPSSMAPQAYSIAPSAPMMQSSPQVNAPSLSDLDLDFPKPKRRTGLIAGGVVAALVAVLGVIGVSAASGSVAEAPKAAAALAAPPPVAPPPPSDPNANPFAETIGNSGSHLTEEQKKALAEADKKREAASKSRAQQKADSAPAHGSPHRKGAGGNVFHKGGNQYDPLNSNL